ncbi:hypothetical protein G4W71_08955 [Clostridium botulinum]|uniref:hypothetical protein n=1 Tax=Clostridium botulinum TaxID=1491 RepID=UPI001788AE09|nr:hypothetical protein [Clostridium botulinum]MBE1304147.1 hypothetical protein [Clostridium botulinum]
MDDFKKANISYATSEDYNATRIVKLRDRSKIAKRLRRYARRKLKHEFNKNKLVNLKVNLSCCVSCMDIAFL